jgi:hypothetical protein
VNQKGTPLNLTLRLKLHINEVTKAVLLDTLCMVTDCFNGVCRYGWATGNATGRACITSPTRACVPLTLHSRRNCSSPRIKATESLKSPEGEGVGLEVRRKQEKSVSCPQSALYSVRYNARSYWVKLSEGVASLFERGARRGVFPLWLRM